jgi:hypothetical protein
MQSEAAYTTDVLKLIECVDNEETALIPTDRTYQAVQTEQRNKQLEA